MAACYKLACNRCDYAVEIWDEGNPYAQDWRGRRWFIYHPHFFKEVAYEYERHEGRFVSQEEKDQLLWHRGNAVEHVCLTCGRITWIDRRFDSLQCWWCDGAVIRGFALAGLTCPRCCEGVIENQGIWAIS
jgi:hypothetical protein